MIDIKQRRTELQREYEKGQQKLAELERAANQLRAVLLRIEGAMQVLGELNTEQVDEVDET